MIFKRIAEGQERRRRERYAAHRRALDLEQETLAEQRAAEQARKDAEARKVQQRKDKVEAAVQAMLSELNRRAAAHHKTLAPLGTPIETAIEPAFLTGFPKSGGYTYFEDTFDDSFRPDALRLARKFIRPDEQVLAAIRVRYFVDSPPISVIVFTHGFAVKGRGAAYRTDTHVGFKTERPTSILGDKDEPPFVMATLTLGDTTLSIPSNEALLFHALWLQEDLRTASKPAPKTTRKAAAKSGRPRKSSTAPAARLIRTARDAELVAAEWMTHLGYTNVAPTPVGADGGVDVTSDQAVAQVKAETIPVGRPKIQQHHGVGVAHGKQALFFSLSGYTPQAKTYAEQNGVVLFAFNLQGEPEAVNTAAFDLLAAGLTPNGSTRT